MRPRGSDRPGWRAPLVVAVAVLGLTLAGCGSGEPGASGAGAGAGASSSATPGEPAEASASPTASPSGPAPATGPLIAVFSSSFHAPEGWQESGGISRVQNSASRPGPGGLIVVSDMESLATTTIDARVQIMMDKAPRGARRLPDVTLGDDGTVAGVITFREHGTTVVQVVAQRAGRTINLEFVLRPRDLERDPDLVASVLASWEWVDGAAPS